MPKVVMELIQDTVNSSPEPQQLEALMAEASEGNIIDRFFPASLYDAKKNVNHTKII